MMKLSLLEIFREDFGSGMSSQGRQDPRTIAVKRQLVSLIDTTDFDDNQSVDRLKNALNQILDTL